MRRKSPDFKFIEFGLQASFATPQEIMLKKKLLTAVLSATLIGSGVGPAFVNTDANIENTMDANMDIQSHQGLSIVGDWSGVLETE